MAKVTQHVASVGVRREQEAQPRGTRHSVMERGRVQVDSVTRYSANGSWGSKGFITTSWSGSSCLISSGSEKGFFFADNALVPVDPSLRPPAIALTPIPS